MLKRFVGFVVLMSAFISVTVNPVFGFELNGFADMTYQSSSSDKADDAIKNGSFMMGGVDFFAAHNLSDRLDVLSEVVFEAPGGDMIVDVERIEVGYAYSDSLSLRIGRFHTPVGYYANVYHHGRQLDSPILRPQVLEFEDGGGLVPGHQVGLWARGNINNTLGTLKYNVAVSNGHKFADSDPELKINMTADDNANKALVGSLIFEPKFLNGVGVGISYLSHELNRYASCSAVVASDNVTVQADCNNAVSLDQQIVGYNMYYDTPPVQFIAEYYSLKDKDTLVNPEKEYTSNGYFIQAAYDYNEKYRPYIRYEELNPDANDPFTTVLELQDLKRSTLGIRYSLTAESSIKIEGMSETKDNNTYTVYGFQWAFTF